MLIRYIAKWLPYDHYVSMNALMIYVASLNTAIYASQLATYVASYIANGRIIFRCTVLPSVLANM